MHILDFIMYFVCLGIIWFILDVISGGDLTNEMGGFFVGLPITMVYTIVYLILFVVEDYNWIDIFHSISFNFKW